VSDSDRALVTAALRAHCVDGRITVAELEQRIESAMAARTGHELSAVVHDLPKTVAPVALDSTPRRIRVGPPGLRPFTIRVELATSVERARNTALDTIAIGLNGSGFELREHTQHTLEFVGAKPRERVVLSFEPRGEQKSTMLIYGRAYRNVRKQFSRLSH
jgi:hypothetical protein